MGLLSGINEFFGNDPNDGTNMLMRFGAALQGPEAQAMMQQQQQQKQMQSALAALAPRIKAGDKSALLEFAAINPEAAGQLSKIMELSGSKPKIQEVGGKLVRFDENDPNSTPEVIYGNTPGVVDPKVVEGEEKLRKEFDSLNKDFRTVQDGYTRLEAAATDPSAAGDLALIFSYMKILDPGSTVREGEFANAQNATSVPGAVMNAYNRALTGERLNPEMRQDFVSKAKSLYQAQAKTYNQTAKKFRGYAKEYGLEPDRITKEIPIPMSKEERVKMLVRRAKGG